MSDEVLVERREGVLVITINRPDAKNAVNGAVAALGQDRWLASHWLGHWVSSGSRKVGSRVSSCRPSEARCTSSGPSKSRIARCQP